MNESPPHRRLFAPAPFPRGEQGVAEVLRSETVGRPAAHARRAVALVWANSPWSSAYEELSDLAVGPQPCTST